ncbi:hypothetical protein M6B38_323560 [Iris pallida]|uniref:Uncharacterized protein n=1 Tax=Iris pallida TaxID=29817 RepID=A0AAX6H9Z7_IRIPA|nr:hypothetical protein M6B38_323560 [Iris pallida]
MSPVPIESSWIDSALLSICQQSIRSSITIGKCSIYKFSDRGVSLRV